MATTVVPTSYKVLVKQIASAFYGGLCPPLDRVAPDDRQRAAKVNTTGLGCVLLGALTERPWVREDQLAADLCLHPKVVRRAMRFFEEEQIVMREHRKESKRQQKREAAALDQAITAEEEEQMQQHTITYCALDYPRLLDSVRWRIETMRRNVKRACENRQTVQKYRCTQDMCAKVYSSLDVHKLEVNFSSGTFICAICGADIDMLIGEEGGAGFTGSTAERRAHVEAMKALHQILDSALEPITSQLALCASQPAPDFNGFQAWFTEQVIIKANEKAEATQAAAAAARGADSNALGGSMRGGGLRAEQFDSSMQVVLSFGDEAGPSGAGGAGDGGAAAARPAAKPAAAPKAAAPPAPWLQGQANGGGAGAGGRGGAGGAPRRGSQRQQDLDALIAGIKGNPDLSEEDRQRQLAFYTQLAAQRAAAAARGAQVAVPWLQSKFAEGGGGGGAAGGAAGGGGAAAGVGDEEGEDKKGALLGDGKDGVYGVKVEVGALPGGVKADPGAAEPGGGGGEDRSPPAKRARGPGGDGKGAAAQQSLDWLGDAGELVGGGGGGAAAAGGGAAAGAADGGAPQAAAAAAEAPQQQAADEEEEEWEDV